MFSLILLGLTGLVSACGVSAFLSGEGLRADIVFAGLFLALLTVFFFWGTVQEGRPSWYHQIKSWPRVSSAALLVQYKQILAAILPADYLGQDGLLVAPAGFDPSDRRAEFVTIVPPVHKPARLTLKELFLGNKELFGIPNGARYLGGLHYKLLRRHVHRAQSLLPQEEYRLLLKHVQLELDTLPSRDTIDLRGQMRPGSLAHEAFHDIQCYLLDYRPEVFQALLTATTQSRDHIVRWYNDPDTTQWRTDIDYNLAHIFPETTTDVPYGADWLDGVMASCKQEAGDPYMFINRGFWDHVYPETLKDFGRVEAIPVLLAAAAERDESAGQILAHIFGTVGFNADFYDQMPLLVGVTRRD